MDQQLRAVIREIRRIPASKQTKPETRRTIIPLAPPGSRQEAIALAVIFLGVGLATGSWIIAIVTLVGIFALHRTVTRLINRHNRKEQ